MTEPEAERKNECVIAQAAVSLYNRDNFGLFSADEATEEEKYMRKISFNEGWEYRHLNSDEEWKAVTLPHDAMLYEKRSADNPGRQNVAWFEGRDYEYRKTFRVPEMAQDSRLFSEFEGIYHNAKIFLNGRKVAERPYGYTQIVTDLTDHLNREGENELRVEAYNSDQPNSRWYSGAGIYRPVSLYLSEGEKYILPYGIHVSTVSHSPARIKISVLTSEDGEVSVDLYDPAGHKTLEGLKGKTRSYDEISANDVRLVHAAEITADIPEAELWSAEHPALYRAEAAFGGDRAETCFGIRNLRWGSVSGFTVNGERVILRGACMHSDNQLLGACADPDAEERKVRLLKKAGYNAVRSAHNPCSSAFLDACDRLGMYVLDEYVDMWYIHKLKYDYAGKMPDWWQNDLHDMVDRDFSHPSVVMYSTGNEVTETGEARGIELIGEMTDFIHQLDRTRPVTCGINISLNVMSSFGRGIYSNEKAAADEQTDAVEQTGKKSRLSGSLLYNTVTGIIGREAMKKTAAMKRGDAVTRDAYAKLDIAGYNYGIDRYKADLKKYPHRLILGTETFCSDADRFWKMAQDEPRLIGDFVWAGMDYLGETGIGSWEYRDYADPDDRAGWISAGSGRLDLTGAETGEALYTKTAFHVDNGPYLCVRPVYETGAHTPSSWKMTDAMPSWSWSGCEGLKADIEVYTQADVVEIFLNGRRVAGTGHIRNGVASFRIPYADGLLQAVTYDRAGDETGAVSLKTAGPETVLRLLPEKDQVRSGHLVYVRIRYTDDEGILKPMQHHQVKIAVSGGTLAALGSGCPYQPDGFLTDTVKTRYGEAMAIVRAGSGDGLTVSAEDAEGMTAELNVKITDD